MKKIIILTSLTLMASLASAQEYGRVISATPITRQVSAPSRVCSGYSNQPVYQTNPNGAVLGAVLGGVIGNAVGGHHRGGSTVAGIITGSVIGSQINSGYTTVPVQNCYTQNSFQTVNDGYSVVYEYRGIRYNTQTSTYPGEYIAMTDNSYQTYAPEPVYNLPPAPPVFIPQAVYAPVYVPLPVYRNYGGGHYGDHRRHGW